LFADVVVEGDDVHLGGIIGGVERECAVWCGSGGSIELAGGADVRAESALDGYALFLDGAF